MEYDDGADDSLEDEAYDNQVGGPGHGGGRHARDPWHPQDVPAGEEHPVSPALHCPVAGPR